MIHVVMVVICEVKYYCLFSSGPYVLISCGDGFLDLSPFTCYLSISLLQPLITQLPLLIPVRTLAITILL